MLNLFETARGTTAGSKHRRGLLESNQDAVLVRRSKRLITMTTPDGCSAAKRSDVGAYLQADWITQLIHEHNGSFDESAWCAFADEIAHRIKILASWSRLDTQAAIAETWLATLPVVVIDENTTSVACFGDGLAYINGQPITFAAANEGNNQPAYPAYLVVESTLPRETLAFSVTSMPTADVNTVLLATDGLEYFIRAEGKHIPGTDDTVPGVSYFWENDAFFRKSTALGVFLQYASRDWRDKPHDPITGGRMVDDLTVSVARRKRI